MAGAAAAAAASPSRRATTASSSLDLSADTEADGSLVPPTAATTTMAAVSPEQQQQQHHHQQPHGRPPRLSSRSQRSRGGGGGGSGGGGGAFLLHHAAAPDQGSPHHPRPRAAAAAADKERPLDPDSSEIVKMALNLSESRRLAARRVPASAAPPATAATALTIPMSIPPRLLPVPLPDGSSPGDGLRQHLQQQRWSLPRALSPGPAAARRLASTSLLTPNPAVFDVAAPGPGYGYQYDFSTSTLARTRKAKQYLELLGQYWRLLEVLPPIRLRLQDANPPISPPPPPLTLPPAQPAARLGRKYNPLQFIRNRKVRARERKAIDGEAQGFGDPHAVADWVQEVTLRSRQDHPTALLLPPFPGPGSATAHALPPDPAVRPAAAATPQRPQRPRVDWSVDPANMLADAYWLAHDDNRLLIEDRLWRRIFPPPASAPAPQLEPWYQHPSPPQPAPSPLPSPLPPHPLPPPPPPTNRSDENMSPARLGRTESREDEGWRDRTEFSLNKTDTEHSHGSARERARQKLHEIRGLHRRHSSTHSHRDFLRNLAGSASELSDSDGESRAKPGGGGGGRRRRNTLTSSGRDILEKQMREMMEREEAEAVAAAVATVQSGLRDIDEEGRSPSVTQQQQQQPPPPLDRVPSKPASRLGSRVNSSADVSESDDGPPGVGRRRQGLRRQAPHPPPPPQQQQQLNQLNQLLRTRPGRASLEVPNRRVSLEIDSSVPNTPDMRPVRDTFPVIGMELSPPASRPSSPMRSGGKLSKVRHIFRDRGDRGAGIDPPSEENIRARDRDRDRDPSMRNDETPPERQRSSMDLTISPSRRLATRSTIALDRPSRRLNSLRPRAAGGDDQQAGGAGGVRGGLLKGASRIDNVLRGGVSRISDLLWRRDPSAGSTIDDISEASTSSSDLSVETPPATTKAEPSRRQRGRSRDPRHPYQRNHLPPPNPPSIRVDGIGSLAVPAPPPPSLSRSSSQQSYWPPPRIDVRGPSVTPPPPLALPLPHPTSNQMTTTRQIRDADLSEVEPWPESRGDDGVPPPPPPPGRVYEQPSALARDRLRYIADPSRLTRREIARYRTHILRTGIKAAECARRAAASSRYLGDLPPNHCSVEAASERWRTAEEGFLLRTRPALEARVDETRARVDALSVMAHAAADAADETGRDLAVGQRLRVKHVVDAIEKLLRRRRRRLRWMRRALWLAVEWGLVGLMWYMWFLVTIFGIIMGVKRAGVRSVRWLLWI